MYFGTDSSGNPSWYRDDNGLNIGLGSVATVNGVQIVTNSGTWGISITGNANTATTATTAGALSSMNISQFTNNSGYITGISFANVSSKPTTISGYGITDALNNANTSEQTIGFRYAQINNGGKTIKFDPRWNESTYDADLGTLHIYSTTAAGANYGRTGIALYDGSAYQYLTTKASTTGLFVNNSLIATAGSTPTFAGATLTNNMTFSSQGCKVIFGDSTSGSPSMIGEGLVDTFGADSDFLTIYARSSLRIFTTATNERARFDTNGMNINGTILPGANNSYNLGSATYGWANVYTNDLHLSNMNKPEGNDIDGTSGTWTIQEGAENLYIINNNNGKKFKIDLTEII